MTMNEQREEQPGVVLLTVSEACATLRISRWSLYRLIQGQRLESILIGRRRLVPADAVARFVTELRAGELT